MKNEFKIDAWHLRGRAKIGDKIQVVCYCAESRDPVHDWKMIIDADLFQPKSVKLSFGPNMSISCGVMLANDSQMEKSRRQNMSFGSVMNMVINGHIKEIRNGKLELDELPDTEFWIIEGNARIE